jgi:hypothetical protein
MGSQVTGSISSCNLCSFAKRFRSFPPARIFFRWTDSSAFNRLISTLADSRLFSVSLDCYSGVSSSSSDGRN